MLWHGRLCRTTVERLCFLQPGNPKNNPYSGASDTTIQGVNQNLLVHRVWDSNASTVSAFEQVATPMQLIYDLNVLYNGGTFNSGDTNFMNVMNGLLKAGKL